MVGFDVHLEVFVETVLTEESDGGSGIEVILMLCWLFWFWFDVEVAFETDLAAVVTGTSHKVGDVLLFELDVGVEKGFVAFTSTPEDIAFATEFDAELKSFLDLGGGEAIDFGGVAGTGTVHETAVSEGIGG